MQLLNTICRVMRIKDIGFDENKLDFEIYSEIINKTPEEIYKEILFLIDKISSKAVASDSITNGEKIVNYLNTNFKNSDLSLDTIAAEFNTTPSYVSTIIKNKLGIGFSKYISNLRVTEAMHLLKETDFSVLDIAAKSGFNSKQAFFRTFKSNVGMTPSEYRKQ